MNQADYDIPDKFKNDNYKEPTESDDLTPWRRLIKIIITLFAIGGIIYISGIYQWLFYRRTPDTIVQRPVESISQQEQINLTLNVFILIGNSTYGSERSENNVINMISNADAIWEQADIDLVIGDIKNIKLDEKEFIEYYNNSTNFIKNIPGYNQDVINILLIKSLRGINGLAYTGINAMTVADITSVLDYRTFAHEVGHLLGLDHVANDYGRLMFRGANGLKLSVNEISTARSNALYLSQGN
ncbi:zinc-dependent metalloprotease family protein [Patescibacteria group bacterium]